VVDRLASQLTAIAMRQREDPLVFVANRELFGDLVDLPGFTEPYLRTLESLHTRGARATLESLVTSTVS
jgi:mannitol 2-dehydrogenase